MSLSGEQRPRGRQGRYTISVAARVVGMHPQTLRVYEAKGLLEPSRTEGNTRRYSDEDLVRLQRIQELTELGLNLAGVRLVLEMEEEMARMRQRLERLRRSRL